MNEHGFIKAVHRYLPSEIYRWKIHDTFTGGVPDAYYCGPAGPLFIEYKYIKLPKKADTYVKLNISALQLEFLSKMVKYKQNAIVIVGFVLENKTSGIILKNKIWEQDLNKEYYLSHAKLTKDIAKGIEKYVLP
tara:strand:+ start:322 stop:723 length:402 start_codon:yes stop_codon:yes gene_type:complete